MGKYLNPGCVNFQRSVNSDIYIDKTEMISYLNSIVNTEQCYVCVSRPRRFGKSMAANMLCAYYGKGDSRFLFENKKIAGHEDWDKYLNHFDIIRVVMTDYLKENVSVIEGLDKMQRLVIRDLKKQYPDVDYFDTDDLIQSMSDVYEETGTAFVIVIDEWDAVFRACKEDKDGQKYYLDFLRDWIKDQEYIALAYLTGILPIKKYGQHSALNMFDEYSFVFPMQFAPFTGFTEEEVKDLCEDYNMLYADISAWYDGYRMSTSIPVEMRDKYRMGEYDAGIVSLYSPLSVVKAVSTGIIQNYWNKTETYEALADYIRMDFDGLKESVAILMDGGRVEVNIASFQNDMTSLNGRDDILTMLIHLGYLGYDTETKQVFIPNREILDEFKTSTRSEEWIGTFTSFKKSQELLKATWAMKEDKVAEILEWFHDTAENKTYNSEAALSYAVQMAYYAGQKYYTTIQELDSGKGYVDLCYLPSPKNPDKPALLIELKYDKSLETAIDQIKNKNYPQKLLHYKDNMLIISINYEKDTSSKEVSYKHHNCSIEKMD